VTRAVESVVAQTRKPAQLVLVDDASPDDGATFETLCRLKARYDGDIPTEVVRLDANRGPGSARNRAWEASTQPYLAFLDADDAWHPRKVEIQFGFLELNPGIVLCGHSCPVLRPDEDWPPLDGTTPAHRIGKAELLLRNRLPTPTVMLRRNLPHRFDEGKHHSEDYLLWLRVVLTGLPVWRLDLPLARSFKSHVGAGGLSAGLWSMELGELDTYARLRGEGLLASWWYPAIVSWSLLKFGVRSVRLWLRS
jgi:glycosyltransferase involved in cell wall biosynthesis